MKNNQYISWKTVPVETTSEEGILLKGELHYWAKDFTVCLKDPFEAQGGGGHLMYAIPAVYVTTETPRTDIIQINLLQRARSDPEFKIKTGHKDVRKENILKI